MKDITKGLIAWGVILVVGIGTGLSIGWRLWKPSTAPLETYAKEQRQQDGSLVLERKPQADARPAHEIPKGAKVERVGSVVVQPKAPTPTVDLATPASGIDPRPVQFDWSLVKMPDETRRMVMSSPDGEVIGGVDIPVEPAQKQRQLKWAAGAVYGVTAWGDKAVGGFIDRDFGPLRTGVEFTRNTYAQGSRQGVELRAKVGIRF